MQFLFQLPVLCFKSVSAMEILKELRTHLTIQFSNCCTLDAEMVKSSFWSTEENGLNDKEIKCW